MKIREVGPRDGFQNEPEVLDTATKVQLIDMLSATGLRRLEVTSFVRPDVIPQMADAVEVLESIVRREGVAFSVLVPNQRGLDRALEHRDRFDGVSVFLSASEAHNRRNVNRSVKDSMHELERTLDHAGEAGLRREVVISTAFGCPFQGRVPLDRVLAIATFLAPHCEEIAFGDTTGMANPRQVREFFTASADGLPDTELTAHFHNTRGQGLANVVAAIDTGVTSFEASFGELGGCPVPAGSTGNISTEDLVSMLHEMGLETGVSLQRLIEASRMLEIHLGRPLTAHLLRAGPVDWDATCSEEA